ncbi:MAG: fructosamine kinase family protein [Candidatus Nanopelagicales bacterium]
MTRSFSKSRANPPGETFFPIEAAGLDWLRVLGAPPVPAVRSVSATNIELERICEVRATPAAAEEFGRSLARLHQAGAPAFGSPPTGVTATTGWIGDLPMPYAERDSFAQFWAKDRLGAAARMAYERGGLSRHEFSTVQRVCAEILDGHRDLGAPVRPARLHGDLWSGNVLWANDGRAWMIDPAAHGGHPETDLAMLALFSCPYLSDIRRGYFQVQQLPAGWRNRVGLHQAWPLLVHAALFGGSYGHDAVAALTD